MSYASPTTGQDCCGSKVFRRCYMTVAISRNPFAQPHSSGCAQGCALAMRRPAKASRVNDCLPTQYQALALLNVKASPHAPSSEMVLHATSLSSSDGPVSRQDVLYREDECFTCAQDPRTTTPPRLNREMFAPSQPILM
mmetsp:Transcript_24697/g.75302  ORF Transcript_24697/g.75302 Transcript_24697/m.75302 type:complete len:139 (-) Transcript_24697:446-862(-)